MSVSDNSTASGVDTSGIEQLLMQIDDKLQLLLDQEAEAEELEPETVSDNSVQLVELSDLQNRQTFYIGLVLCVLVGAILGFLIVQHFKP